MIQTTGQSKQHWISNWRPPLPRKDRHGSLPTRNYCWNPLRTHYRQPWPRESRGSKPTPTVSPEQYKQPLHCQPRRKRSTPTSPTKALTMTAQKRAARPAKAEEPLPRPRRSRAGWDRIYPKSWKPERSTPGLSRSKSEKSRRPPPGRTERPSPKPLAT